MNPLCEGIARALSEALAKHTGGEIADHIQDVEKAVEQSIPKSIMGVIEACVLGKAAPEPKAKTKTPPKK